MSVVVTGAAGAVGTYITEILASKGYTVIAIDLSGRQIPAGKNINPYSIDLTMISMQELMEICGHNCKGIIHTAAIVDISKTKEEIWPLNVEATYKLARAAVNLDKEYLDKKYLTSKKEEGTCKFIYISSGSIYSPSKFILNETSRTLATSAYEESKIQSETDIKNLQFHLNFFFNYSILRPALIYGPRARFLGAALAAVPSIINFLKLNIGFSGGPKTNWVHAEDVARAAIYCLENKSTNRKIFNVADDTPTPFGNTISDYLTAAGLKSRLTIPLPSPSTLRLLEPVIEKNILWKITNTSLKILWKTICRSNRLLEDLAVQVDKEVTPYMYSDVIFDNSALKDTGFTFKWPSHKEAIPNVIDWYRKHEWIT